MNNLKIRSRGWCFTLNNYTAEDIEQLEDLKKKPNTRYLVIGREKGEEGTPHFQGYVYFHNPIAFENIKKSITRAHIEKQRGTPIEASIYCKKDGDFTEHGDLPATQDQKGQAGADFWDDVKRKAQANDIDSIPSKVFISHYGVLKRIAADYAPMPEDNATGVCGYWYWGATGTGKSRKARGDNPGAYLKMCNKWWQGYKGEDAVIIEDFDKRHEMLGHFLKIWSDRYAFPAEIKGSGVNLRPRKIIVTSNWHPKDIWPNEPETLEPIVRRFNIVHFN